MIFTVTNTKGGVGKTTTAANLAAGFAGKGRRTLLIDLDPQAHASRYFLDGDPERTVGDLIMDRPSQAGRAISPTMIDRLDLVPATEDLTETAELLSTRIRREERLKRALEPLKDTYREVVIDCPPALAILTYNALIAADLLLVPVQPGVGAAVGLGSLLEAAEELRDEDQVPYRIVITMFDNRTSRTNQIFEELMEDYRKRLLKTIIHKSESLNQANIAGKTIWEFQSNSIGAQDYKALCDEVLRIRVRSRS